MGDNFARAPQSIPAMWGKFERMCVPADIPDSLRLLLRAAFFAGITSLYSEIANPAITVDTVAAWSEQLKKEASDMAPGEEVH